MAYPNNQNLSFIKINKLLGINCNYSEINDFSEVVIPNFVITQLSAFLEKTDSIKKYSIHTGQDTEFLDGVSFSLKNILHILLIATNSFTETERQQALEMILISFKQVQVSLITSEISDLASLVNFAIENIQLACQNESIQEQDLFIAKVLDAIDTMNCALDDAQSSNNTLETIKMSYENLQQNMSYFAARQISLND